MSFSAFVKTILFKDLTKMLTYILYVVRALVSRQNSLICVIFYNKYAIIMNRRGMDRGNFSFKSLIFLSHSDIPSFFILMRQVPPCFV